MPNPSHNALCYFDVRIWADIIKPRETNFQRTNIYPNINSKPNLIISLIKSSEPFTKKASVHQSSINHPRPPPSNLLFRIHIETWFAEAIWLIFPKLCDYDPTRLFSTCQVLSAFVAQHIFLFPLYAYHKDSTRWHALANQASIQKLYKR